MVRSRFIVLAFICLFGWLPVAPLSAADTVSEAGKTSLFVNVTTDDAWTAHMALSYAEQVLGMGHPVAVFLNVRGVRLADRNTPQEPDALSGKTSREMLQDLIGKGATVYVCKMCTQLAGMTEDDWINGAKPGSVETIHLQMAPMTKVMPY
jgi:predicted peroxiredoxin